MQSTYLLVGWLSQQKKKKETIGRAVIINFSLGTSQSGRGQKFRQIEI